MKLLTAVTILFLSLLTNSDCDATLYSYDILGHNITSTYTYQSYESVYDNNGEYLGNPPPDIIVNHFSDINVANIVVDVFGDDTYNIISYAVWTPYPYQSYLPITNNISLKINNGKLEQYYIYDVIVFGEYSWGEASIENGNLYMHGDEIHHGYSREWLATGTTEVVPEPSTIFLVGVGLGAYVLCRRRNIKSA